MLGMNEDTVSGLFAVLAALVLLWALLIEGDVVGGVIGVCTIAIVRQLQIRGDSA